MLTKRNVVVIDWKDLNPEFLRPEQILAKLDDSIRVSPLDIGAWAFSVREKSNNGTSKKDVISRLSGLRVDKSSYQKERVEFIRGFFDQVAISGWRPRTVLNYYHLTGYCLNWCDDNGHSHFLFSTDATRRAYFSFTNFIDREIKLGKLKPRTAATLQYSFRRIIEIYWPETSLDLLRGIPTFYGNRRSRELPYQEEVKDYIDVSLVLSFQISEALIRNKPFPWTLSFGDYDAVIFPSHHGPRTPFKLDIPKSRHQTLPRLKTLEEYLEMDSDGVKTCRYSRKKNYFIFKERFDENNSDSKSYYRLMNASLSMCAYIVLLQIVTGAPSSELLRIEYDEGYVLENDQIKKELSSVKFRAAGKIVRYPLGDIGFRILKKYLNLRSWVLDGESHKYLFFKIDRATGSNNYRFSSFRWGFSTSYIKKLRGLYLPTNALNVAKFGRQYKSFMLHVLKTKSEVIAPLLNHSVETNSSNYSNISPDIQYKEFNAYWDSVHAAANVVEDQGSETKNISGGHCESFDNPSSVIESPPIIPDCKVQQGCLYCKHYVCHADEKDVHKLLSLKYVLHEIRGFSSDIEHSEQLFKDLSIRIVFILEGIKSKSSEHINMVEKLERRVFELGELTPFWEMRMARYEKMGVVV